MGMMMDNNTSKDGHFDVDLEKGGVSGELNCSGGLIYGAISLKPSDSESYSSGVGSCLGSIKSEERLISSINSSYSGGSEKVKLVVVDKRVGGERNGRVGEKKAAREKPKAMSAKKPPKPPRPPRGLSLDSADQKLIRELHEIAKLKRARVERMKALKKAKEAKAASSKNQLFATLLTVLFCVVLLFQGISSRTNSAVNFQGSPTSSGGPEGSAIAIQRHSIPSSSNVNGPDPEHPSLVEQVSGFDAPEKVGRAAG